MADKKKLEKEYDEANSKNKTLEEQENVVIEVLSAPPRST